MQEPQAEGPWPEQKTPLPTQGQWEELLGTLPAQVSPLPVLPEQVKEASPAQVSPLLAQLLLRNKRRHLGPTREQTSKLQVSPLVS